MDSFFNFINNHIQTLNQSKFFAGMVMIMLNIGSKYITVKLSPSQEAYLRNFIARELIIFAVAWMGTRDIYMALLLTATFIILTQHLFNENSKVCVLPETFKNYHLFDTNKDGVVSQKELDDAVQMIIKAKEQQNLKNKEQVYNYFIQNKM
jgi:hypothetical protein